MPTELGTLDATHLATALLWKDMYDGALALASRAHGLPVIGVKQE